MGIIFLIFLAMVSTTVVIMLDKWAHLWLEDMLWMICVGAVIAGAVWMT